MRAWLSRLTLVACWCALAGVLLNACASLTCTVPVADTAERAASLDFTRRADAALLRCRDETFVYSLKVRS